MTAVYEDPYADVPPPDEEPGTFPHRGTERSQRSDLHILGSVPEAFPVRNPDCGYVNVAALLEDGIPEPPTPDVCPRSDSVGLFYRGQFNVVFGDPESGKTLLCDYATVRELLRAGGRVLRLDLDHNGPNSTVNRLIDFGADEALLSDPGRFFWVGQDIIYHDSYSVMNPVSQYY